MDLTLYIKGLYINYEAQLGEWLSIVFGQGIRIRSYWCYGGEGVVYVILKKIILAVIF